MIPTEAALSFRPRSPLAEVLNQILGRRGETHEMIPDTKDQMKAVSYQQFSAGEHSTGGGGEEAVGFRMISPGSGAVGLALTDWS